MCFQGVRRASVDVGIIPGWEAALKHGFVACGMAFMRGPSSVNWYFCSCYESELSG